MKKITFALILTLISPTFAFAISAECAKKLELDALTPPCADSVCSEQNGSPICTDDILSGFPVVTCRNEKTKEEKFFPENTFAESCNALAAKDKSWVVYACYCCCP